MNSKINTIQFYLKNIPDIRVSSLKYKIIIIKNSYFFVVHKGYEEKFYASGHRDIKGWYSGILSFSKPDFDVFYIFISEIYYNYLNTEDSFLKVHKSYLPLITNLKENLPKSIEIDDSTIDNLFNSKEDQTLFYKATIIIPHMSLFALLDRLPPSDESVINLNEVETYLESFEYMIEDHEEHQLEHHHNHHDHS